ncbi:MAG TPA: CHASE2 domain-containing protein [Dictyoglomaceae bacterium]|nr:CHASE2 domain-containing protein [Dictyoglomaceae bacterium]
MRRVFIKIGILLVLFVLLTGLNSLSFFKNLESQSIDLRFQIRGEEKVPEDIVIIGIDDNSIFEIGNWPWKRSLHARLLDVLKEGNPKLIVFDTLFDTSTPEDEIFSSKLKEMNNVILANYISVYYDKNLRVNVFSIKEPVEPLKSSVLKTGFSNLLVDNDNKIRRGETFEQDLLGIRYYSLPLTIYASLNGGSLYSLSLKFPDSFYINYVGGEGSFKYFSYIDVLNKNIPAETFKDKIVFIGATSPVLKDVFLHPFSGYRAAGSNISYSYMPGVEIHVNILNNLINSNFLTTLPYPFVMIINFLSVFLIGITLGRKLIFNFLITIFVMLSYLGGSYFAFTQNLILPFISPSLGLFLGFVGNLIYQNVIPKERLEGMVIKKRYKILKKLGSGGMATVYLALDLPTKKEVAIKILHPQYSEDKEIIARFIREIETCKILDHSNIVKVLDHGKEEDYLFMVMEYVSGKDLKKILEEKGPLPVPFVTEVIKKVVEALSYANSKDIVHRDIKPQNIMITNEGNVKLMDFGIARIGGTSTLTQTGVFMGTPQYASPEQLEGKKIDIRSDIFSLGIVFYETLTGIIPYAEDTTISLMLKRYQEDLPDIRKINPNIPEGIAKIIEKMTARFPEFRYQTPKELLEDLKRGYPLHPYEKGKIISEETIIKKDREDQN